MSVKTCLSGKPDGIYLVINSDDFGLCQSVNQAIIQCYKDNTLTSASIMPPCGWAEGAIRFIKENPQYSAGIHLTLANSFQNYRFGPILSADKVPSLVDEHGYFKSTTEEMQKSANPEEVKLEVEAQIEWMLDYNIPLSHLDNHMMTLSGYPETNRSLWKILYEAAEKYKLPLINYETAYNHRLDIFKELNGFSDWAETEAEKKKKVIECIEKMGPGLHNLTCHVGLPSPELKGMNTVEDPWDEKYRVEDYNILHSDEVRNLIKDKNIRLIGMNEIKNRGGLF